MKDHLDINLGVIYKYFRSSLFLFSVGIALIWFYWILSIPVIIISIYLFQIKSGIHIDSEKMIFRKYDVLLGKKYGKWIELRNVELVVLRRASDAQTMNSRGTTITTNVKTFDVLLKSGDEMTEIHDFKDYKTAFNVLNYLKIECSLKTRNLFQEQMDKR